MGALVTESNINVHELKNCIAIDVNKINMGKTAIIHGNQPVNNIKNATMLVIKLLTIHSDNPSSFLNAKKNKIKTEAKNIIPNMYSL